MRKFLTLAFILLLFSCGRQDEKSEVNAVGTCIDMRLETQCHNQRVCKYTCSAAAGAAGALVGEGVGAAAGVGIAGQFCADVCEEVPACSQISVCYKWDRAPF